MQQTEMIGIFQKIMGKIELMRIYNSRTNAGM